MDISYLDAVLFKILGKVFRHLTSKRGNENALVLLNSQSYLTHKVVNLTFNVSDLYFGVNEARRSDKLLCGGVRMLTLVVSRRCADEYRLIYLFLELFKEERTVIVSRGQTETEINEIFLSRRVTTAHTANLRQSYVRLVNEKKKILREIIEKRVRRRACGSACENS